MVLFRVFLVCPNRPSIFPAYSMKKPRLAGFGVERFFGMSQVCPNSLLPIIIAVPIIFKLKALPNQHQRGAAWVKAPRPPLPPGDDLPLICQPAVHLLDRLATAFLDAAIFRQPEMKAND